MFVTIYGIKSTALVLAFAAFASAASATSSAKETAPLNSDTVGTGEMEQLADFVTQHPNDVDARWRLAVDLNRKGFQSLAAEQLEAADKLKSGFVIDRFHTLVQQDRLAAASDVFFYTAKRHPDDPDVLLLTSIALLGHNQADMAQNLLDKAISLSPSHKGLHLAKAQVSLAQKQWQAALTAARDELKLYPECRAAKTAETRALLELGISPATVGKNLLEADATSVDRNYMLARFCVKQGRYKEAVKPLLITIALSDKPRTFRETDELLVEALQHVPAAYVKLQADAVDQSISNSFLRGFFHLRLGDIFQRCKDYPLANQEYLQSMRAHPFFEGNASFRLARNLDTKLQQPLDAMPYYKRAQALKPYDKQVSCTVARIVSRMQNRHRDIAWQLKSLLWQNVDKTH